MSQSVEAIYENGVLRPLKPLNLQEHARVRIVIETEEEVQARVQAMMDLAHSVYEGFSDSEIAEIEAVALDRSRWSTE